jgi:hypothetical protein
VTRTNILSTAAALVLAGAVVAALALLDHAQPAENGGGAVRRMVNVRAPIAAPFLLFRTLAPRRAFGRLAMVHAHDQLTRFVAPLTCARVHYAGGSGVCLVEHASGTTLKHIAYLFDRTFARGAGIALAGVPTRVRVSPDGRWAAVTTYAEEELPGGERLASESVLIDISAGRIVADLREFRISNDAYAPLAGPIDIAGVAFAGDSDHFYASLSTPSKRYLAAGSIAARRVELIAVGMANEAVSPDGRRLVVKRQVGNHGQWQLAVLDLGSMESTTLHHPERSVDDQVEWLDDTHVVYHDAAEDATGVWMLSTDGLSGPQLLIPDAFSPVVIQ